MTEEKWTREVEMLWLDRRRAAERREKPGLPEEERRKDGKVWLDSLEEVGFTDESTDDEV